MLAKRDLFDELFDSFDVFRPLSVRPLVDLRDSHGVGVRRSVTNDELTLSVDLPGTKKEDVDVMFESNGYVRISAKRSDLQEESTYRYSLGSEWDRDSGEATLEDGVLSLRFKKREEAKPRKLLLK